MYNSRECAKIINAFVFYFLWNILPDKGIQFSDLIENGKNFLIIKIQSPICKNEIPSFTTFRQERSNMMCRSPCPRAVKSPTSLRLFGMWSSVTALAATRTFLKLVSRAREQSPADAFIFAFVTQSDPVEHTSISSLSAQSCIAEAFTWNIWQKTSSATRPLERASARLSRSARQVSAVAFWMPF